MHVLLPSLRRGGDGEHLHKTPRPVVHTCRQLLEHPHAMPSQVHARHGQMDMVMVDAEIAEWLA